jgi:hypothetical protein
VVQLAAGKVVTCPIDPLFIYNWAFGVRLAYDAAGAAAAFKAAGRDYVHVLASPSSRPGPGGRAGRARLPPRRGPGLPADRRHRVGGAGAAGPRRRRRRPVSGHLAGRLGDGDQTRPRGGLPAAVPGPRSRPFRTGDGERRAAAVRLRHHHPAVPLAVSPRRPGRGVGRGSGAGPGWSPPAGPVAVHHGRRVGRPGRRRGRLELDHTASRLDPRARPTGAPSAPRTPRTMPEGMPCSLDASTTSASPSPTWPPPAPSTRRCWALRSPTRRSSRSQGVHELLLRAGEAYGPAGRPLHLRQPGRPLPGQAGRGRAPRRLRRPPTSPPPLTTSAPRGSR